MVTSRRLKYEFDNFVVAGTPALIGWLAVVTFILAVSAGLVLVATGSGPPGEDLGLAEAVWTSLMRTLDPGTMGADRGWVFRLIMLAVTLGGILLVSTLIAVLNSGITQKYDKLQRGRSLVLEKKHVVILGWSEVVFAIVQQFAEAARSRTSPLLLVLMSERDPLAVREEVAAKVKLHRRVKVACRRGSPTNLEALRRVSAAEASSLVIVAPDSVRTDDHTIRTLLAVRRVCEQAQPPRAKLPMAVELKAKSNLPDLVLSVGPERETMLHVVKSDQLLARIVVQSSRQSGLSHVYTELMSFEGNEIYQRDMPPGLAGRSFGELVTSFTNGVVIGLMRAERPQLGLEREARVLPGDKLIVVMETVEDALSVRGSTSRSIPTMPTEGAEPDEPPENILILGWNERGRQIVEDLSRYAPPGSQVEIVYDPTAASNDAGAPCGVLRNTNVTCRAGVTHTGEALRALRLAARQRLIVLGYTEKLSRSEADTRTLLTLLHIREALGVSSPRPTIVSEMLDVRNRELADLDGSDDFVVSDHLISLKLAQVAENICAREVLDHLLSPTGSEVYMRPARLFAPVDAEVDFWGVQQAALSRGEIALGYRFHAQRLSKDANHGICLNPKDKDKPLRFGPEDKIVVIAGGRD